jgi:hypothetical protein
LSEVDGGTVYPCDSLVLNNCAEAFVNKYQLCKSQDILKFLDGQIDINFKPCNDCTGCVFTKNIKMLDDWKNGRIDLFDTFKNIYFNNEEFV